MKTLFGLILIILGWSIPADAQVAAGGQFTLDQTVIAGGGETNFGGGQFTLSGTIGQSVAGQSASGNPFSVHAGFWNPPPFAPTAAAASVSGRAMTSDGRGIRSVFIRLTDMRGNLRTVMTSAFGYYRFEDVAAGETYIITAVSKRFTFTQQTQVLNFNENTEGINFIAVDNFNTNGQQPN